MNLLSLRDQTWREWLRLTGYAIIIFLPLVATFLGCWWYGPGL